MGTIQRSAVSVLIGVASCTRPPGFIRSSNGSYNSKFQYMNKERTIEKSTAGGATTAKISASSNESQILAIPKESGLGEVKITFPPGTLSVDTSITVEESLPVASNSLAAELNVNAQLSPAGKSVSIIPAIGADPVQPFTVSLAIDKTNLKMNEDQGLLNSNLIVVYRMQSFAENKVYVGLLPESQFQIQGGQVTFKASLFGAFQLAYSSVPIKEPTRTLSQVPVTSKAQAMALPPLKVLARNPVVIAPGDNVEVRGTHFRPSLVVAMGGKLVDGLKVVSDTKVAFFAPKTGTFGINSLEFTQDGVSETMSVFYRGDKTELPIITSDPQNICEGTKFYDQSGTLKVGTKVCQSFPVCSKDEEVGCITTENYKATGPSKVTDCRSDGQSQCMVVPPFVAASTTGLAPKILAGQTVAGVTGILTQPSATHVYAGIPFGSPGFQQVGTLTLPAPSQVRVAAGLYGIGGTGSSPTLGDCTANNMSDCVTTTTYRSADWTNLVSSHIKNGVSIAGVMGSYPSSSHPLTGADSTADLDTATFDAKIKSSLPFEWFGPDGTRYTASGDIDIAPSHISNAVTIFGTTGTIITQCTATVQNACESNPVCIWNSGSCQLNSWNIRFGTSIAGVPGTLKTNCRNTIKSDKYNYDGTVASLPNSSVVSGTVLDFWDTIDDSFGFSPLTPAPWMPGNLCDGSNWVDVTTTDGGTSLIPCGTSGICIYRDQLSGLMVSGRTALPSTYTWSQAVQGCANLSYGGFAAGSWRLPTQKEIFSLYQHGILSLVNASFFTLTDFQSNFWTSSSYSSSGASGWYMQIASGYLQYQTKPTVSKVLCVR